MYCVPAEFNLIHVCLSSIIDIFNSISLHKKINVYRYVEEKKEKESPPLQQNTFEYACAASLSDIWCHHVSHWISWPSSMHTCHHPTTEGITCMFTKFILES